MSDRERVPSVADAIAAYPDLVDVRVKAEREETIDAVREGLADVASGRMKSARSTLKAVAKKYGILADRM